MYPEKELDSPMESENEDDDFFDNENLTDRLKTAGGECPNQSGQEDFYEVVTAARVVEEMNNCISEVNSVINLPKTTTRVLLNYFRWDKEKIIEKFYDEDQEKLFAEARVVNPFVVGKPEAASSSEANECQVCLSTVEPSEMSALPCGHLFCTNCWAEYLRTKITSSCEAVSIACLAYNCGILIDDETVNSHLNFYERAKYQRLITNSFVESNKWFCWCPSPGCDKAIKVKNPAFQMIKCSCKHIFCFLCGESWHEPLNCDYLRKWLKKNTDDFETMIWMSIYTKDCPLCHTIIEKSGGCNIMFCINCKQSFCWVCLSPWNNHASCGLYGSETLPLTEAQSSNREALEKYLFYSDRYNRHQQSLNLEGLLYEKLEQQIEKLVCNHSQGWIDVKYLLDAVDTLRSCRQTLSYTFAFAYYIRKNYQTIIFEDNQNDLHRAVENLSQNLEKDVSIETFSAMKIKVLDLSCYCEGRRKTLLNHVQEGEKKNWWTFTN